VYAALQEYSLPGLDLKVRSAIRTRDGFGSSSALCLGTMLAASFLATGAGQNDIPAPLRALLPAAKKAYELQKQAQGFASGYDIATQLVGGLVLFSQREDAPWPFMLERLPHETAARIPGLISLYTGGRGAPTTTVGGKTAPWLRERFGIAAVVEASADLVKGFLDLLGNEPAQRSADIWAQFFVALQAHRQLFIDAPAYPRGLFSALSSLPGFDRRWSAKPSGAGGEDALLLMGKSPDDLLQADALLQQHGWSRCAYSLADQGAALVGHDEKQEALQ
jgi:mevalonate kinase